MDMDECITLKQGECMHFELMPTISVNKSVRLILFVKQASKQHMHSAAEMHDSLPCPLDLDGCCCH
jgi:hypothetical protein